MARIRSLKPEITSDVKLASVSVPARLTFIYAITQADDIGLLPGAHRQLLGALYPLNDDITVPMLLGWIEELASVGLVRWRSTRDGVPVLQLANWGKHQRIDNAGRSQLGSLLAESPAEPSTQPSEQGVPSPVADVRGDSPPLAAVRGLDLRPTILDLGSRTTDQGPPTRSEPSMQAIVGLVTATNRGLSEHAKRPQSIPTILPSSGKSREAAEVILATVPQAFAESALYELAKSHTADGPVKSLLYFASAVVRKWNEHEAAVAVRTSSAPPPLPKHDAATNTTADPVITALDQWARDTDAKERSA